MADYELTEGLAPAVVAWQVPEFRARTLFAAVAVAWAAAPLSGLEPQPVVTLSDTGSYILMGVADVYDSALQNALIGMGTDGRGVEWGWLQEATELETSDWEVITGEDGRVAAAVPRNPRTEISCTAIFRRDRPLPARGSRISWLTIDGAAVNARVLSRRVVYELGNVVAVAISATHWHGMP